MDRRTTGAVATLVPGKGVSASATSVGIVPPTAEELTAQAGGVRPRGQLGAFHAWAREVRQVGMDVGLVTNNHICFPCGSTVMLALAGQMRTLLEQYAREVDLGGREAVMRLDRQGRAKCALPTGTIGMLLFQRAVRQELESDALVASNLARWSLFNPVEATEAARMRRILEGEVALYGCQVRAVHIFRQVRDEWERRGFSAALSLAVRTIRE